MLSFLCKSYVSWNLAGVFYFLKNVLKQCHVFWSNYYEFLKFQKGESITFITIIIVRCPIPPSSRNSSCIIQLAIKCKVR